MDALVAHVHSSPAFSFENVAARVNQAISKAEAPGPEETPDPPPSDEHKHRMTTGNLMARFAPETRHILVMEFIWNQHLSEPLNDFLRKRLR